MHGLRLMLLNGTVIRDHATGVTVMTTMKMMVMMMIGLFARQDGIRFPNVKIAKKENVCDLCRYHRKNLEGDSQGEMLFRGVLHFDSYNI